VKSANQVSIAARTQSCGLLGAGEKSADRRMLNFVQKIVDTPCSF
jgi:hypothetical protein